MKAYIMKNVTDGQVMIKSSFREMPIKLAKNEEYMFKSEHEFFSYQKNAQASEKAGFVVIQTIAEKKSVSMYSAPKQPVEPKLEEQVSEEQSEDKNSKLKELKVELKSLQDEFKTTEDDSRKEEIKKRINEIKKEVKAVK